MEIKGVLNKVYDEEVGWRPGSGAIKPVHVANGLLRELQGGYVDIEPLHRFLVDWENKRANTPNEKRSTEALLADNTDGVFTHFQGRQLELDRARRYARGMLGSDGALFPSIDQSAFSLTAFSMVSRDTYDRGLGAFAKMLIGGSDDAASLGAAVHDAATHARPMDPVTALVWPLLRGEVRGGRSGKSKSAEPGVATIRVRAALERKHQAAFLEEVRAASSDLATHERAQGNRLRTLQRAVQFSCVATFAHAQALSADGRLPQRSPILLAFAGGKRGDLAAASERSVEGMLESFQSWLGDQLARKLKKDNALLPSSGEGKGVASEPLELPQSLDGRAVRHFLQHLGDARGSAPSEECIQERKATFNALREERAEEGLAAVLGHTIAQCYFDEFANGGPRRFLVNLGRRVGLLYPHFQGRSKEKRARPSVLVLDMLVRACVPWNQQVRLEEFLERLWLRFGFIVGGRRAEGGWDDVRRLADADLAVDPNELERNTDALVDELTMMGLARRYPDNVTFIGDANGG